MEKPNLKDFQYEQYLYSGILMDIIRYIYQKKGLKNNDSDLQAFFDNSHSFPKFACILLDKKNIPNISERVLTSKDTINNNDITLRYLKEKSNNKLDEIPCYYDQFKYANEYETFNFIIMKIILRDFCFRSSAHLTIKQSNKLFESMQISIKRKNELYTGLYITRLLHVLTDGKVKISDSFNGLEQVFQTYKIPFLLIPHSLLIDGEDYFLLQIRIIFDKFEEKVKSIIGVEDKEDEEFEKQNKIDKLNKKSDEWEEEKIFLRLCTILGKQFGLQFYDFTEIIETGFIPKIFMHFLKIDSIEKVTDIDNDSIDVQIKNIEEVIKFIKKNNSIFDVLLFDFKTPSKRVFSVRSILRNIFNLYFLKSSRKEMVDRYYLLAPDGEKCDQKAYYCKDMIFRLLYFFINGKRYKYSKKSDSSEIDVCYDKYNILGSFDDKSLEFNNINYFMNDFIFYQMQILFNLIDNGPKSRHLVERMYKAESKFKIVKLPKFSTIKAAILAKQVYHNDKIVELPESDNYDKIVQAEWNDELCHLTMKMNENPTTFAERYQKQMKCIDSNSSKHEKVNIITSEEYWNKLPKGYQCKNGLLFNSNQNITNSSSDKWMNEINKIKNILKDRQIESSALESIKQKSPFSHPRSNTTATLYKIFHYNEISKMWEFDKEKFNQFLIDKQINVEGSNTPIISYIDSKENDLISLNRNFLIGEFPNLDDNSTNEIFVYALCDRSLSFLNYEVDFINKEKAAIKPIFLLLHVPKIKETHPNIRLILIQIYSFLSLISDIRVIILDHSHYETQIKNMSTIYKIVDKNLCFMINMCNNHTNGLKFENESDFSDEESESSYDFSYDDLDYIGQSLFANENLNKTELEEDDKYKMIYSRSKIIFLINDQAIEGSIPNIDEYIDKSQYFTEIKEKFENEISMHFINTSDYLTYKSFLDQINDLCLTTKRFKNEMINNFECIKDVSHMSNSYITIIESDKEIRDLSKFIYNRYCDLRSADENAEPILLLTFIQEEIKLYSPKFDYHFRYLSENSNYLLVKDANNIDRNKLKQELNQSATEKLEYFNYQIHQRYFWTREQIEKIKRTHRNFLENEYFSIIQIIGNKSLTTFLFEQNNDILNDQIELDKQRLDEIFEPFIKKLELKETSKKIKFKDAKRKGTSYIMKETESVKEVKVTLEMKEDLKSIIEQDF